MSINKSKISLQQDLNRDLLLLYMTLLAYQLSFNHDLSVHIIIFVPFMSFLDLS